MRPSPVIATVLTLAAGLSACGSSSPSTTSSKPVNPNAKEKSPPGDIPDNQAYVPFAVPGNRVTVKVPEGWSRTTSGGAVVFTDKLNSVRIQTARAAGALSAKGLKGQSVAKLKRAGTTAIRVKYLTVAPPNAVTGKTITDAVERYAYVHNGTALILTLSGPKGADNVDPWRLISNSVRWK